MDLYLEKYLGQYNPLNAAVGFPVTLTGKKDDDYVNFEILLKASDPQITMYCLVRVLVKNLLLVFQYHCL